MRGGRLRKNRQKEQGIWLESRQTRIVVPRAIFVRDLRGLKGLKCPGRREKPCVTIIV